MQAVTNENPGEIAVRVQSKLKKVIVNTWKYIKKSPFPDIYFETFYRPGDEDFRFYIPTVLIFSL